MGESGPHVHTIPSGASFLDALARGIVDRYNDRSDPLALSRITVLLPTRRAVRALGDAFARTLGGTVILPTVRPIGDIDEDVFALEGDTLTEAQHAASVPPAISSVRRTMLIMDRFRRRFLLSRLVQTWLEATGGDDNVVLATELAQSLSEFLDLMQTENVDLDRLENLVPDQFADHWRRNIEFLEIITKFWPQILKQEGAIDPGERRNFLLKALNDRWHQSPPEFPVIAAGSTGSIPATAALLKTVAHLPKGHVVLPGLDLDMSDSVWNQLEQGHPQDGMKRLLGQIRADRQDVTLWDKETVSPDLLLRTRLLNAALAPWPSTGQWRTFANTLEPRAIEVNQALKGIKRIDAAHSGEEAGAISLIMREALETPGKTVALITPDRVLARRVTTDLGRWNVEVNDSAGRPLEGVAVFSYLRLIARACHAQLEPVALLSLLKHPFAAGGLTPPEFRRTARFLEVSVLRGPSPGPGIDGLRHAIRAIKSSDDQERLDSFVDRLEHSLSPLLEMMASEEAPFTELVQTHIHCAESLATTDEESGADRLWVGDAGEAAALFVEELLEHGPVLESLEVDQYPELFEILGNGRVVRSAAPIHPRLSIWGPLEARLQRADVTILAGLNEGTWPAEPKMDPWLSRPMRASLELSAPEQRIGLAAHDFIQGASSPVVFLTRSEKTDGTPTVPSRWLLRVETLLDCLGQSKALTDDVPYLAWSRALESRLPDVSPSDHAPVGPPAPRPPVSTRPRQLSVTQIETWIRDPYAVYARHVLGLKPLDPLNADAGALERGILIHDILHAFVSQYPEDLPQDAERRLLALGRQFFDEAFEGPEVEAFWWPRFESFAKWFIPHEQAWRAQGIAPQITESSGRLKIDGPAGPFLLTARLDRLDRQADGSRIVLDYKTGVPPTKAQVEAGLAPQLPLEASIVQAGGFEGVGAHPVAALGYIHVAGGAAGGKLTWVAKDGASIVQNTLDGLSRLIAAYDEESTPYRSRLRPQYENIAGPYDHLARVKEWAAGTTGEGA